MDDPILAAMRARQEFDLPQPSAHPLQDGIDRIGQRGEGFELGAGTVNGKVGVQAEGFKNVGRGWSVGGAVSYVKDMGAAAWGKVKWTPKK